MALFPLLMAALGVVGADSSPRSLVAWIGSDEVRLQVSRTERLPGGLLLQDSLILVTGQPESSKTWRGETDTLVGPVRLVRHGRNAWRVPEGAMLRRSPLVWGLPTPPPLQVSGNLLCHWNPVVAKLGLRDRPATWDSVCFDHSGDVRTARLLSKWEEWHPWISMRVERDSGHRMRGPVFVNPPDRMVLEPDPAFARVEGAETGYTHAFQWLDDSGTPLKTRRILSWSSLDGMPCLRARAGKLEASVRPRFSSLFRPVCWLSLPGSGDTLTEFEDGTNEVTHPGWRIDTAGRLGAEGWSPEPAAMTLENVLQSEGLQYEVKPESYRWRWRDALWAPVLPDRFESWLRPEVPLDSIPPRQDPDLVWDVEPAPLPQGSLAIAGFGTVRWTKRFRWRTPDSLVVRGMLGLAGEARKTLKRDSLEIEVAARWDSSGLRVDTSGAFRTVAQTSLFLGGGAVLGGRGSLAKRNDDTCPTVVLEHDAQGTRVLALCPGNGICFLEGGDARWVVDGRLDNRFRPVLGGRAILGGGPKSMPRTRRYPPRHPSP